jgi:succinate dehydrogenase hydrophobic anchor subunit
MAAGTPNPDPKGTVWCILALTLIMVLIVGWLAVSKSSQGYFHMTSTGGGLPAAFVFIAVLVGIACVALFVRRGHGEHHK